MSNQGPHTKARTAFQLMIITIFLLTLTACAEDPLTPQDMVYADVSFQMDVDSNELTLVSSTRDVAKLTGYLNALLLSQPVQTSIVPDLNYHLDLRTNEVLHTFTLSFNLADKQALATNETGSYQIPFEWLNDYLTDLPIHDHFGHLAPPTLELYIENVDSSDLASDSTYNAHSSQPHKISTSLEQKWFLQPTLEVGYPVDQSIQSSELLTRDNLDFKLYGAFSHNGPSSYSIEINNNDDQGKSPIIDLTLPANTTVIESLPIPDQPGNYTYKLNCQWSEPENGYQGTITYAFDINIEEPIAYGFSGDIFAPGDCMAILVENAQDLDYRVETPTFTKTIALFYYDENPEEISPSNPRDLVGLIPIDSRTTPGDYEVKLYRDSTDELLQTFAYTLTEKDFNTQNLIVSTSTANLKSNNNAELDRAKFAHAKSYSVGEKLWDGPFLIPLDEYRVSTEYATIRYVNSSTTESSRHNAIDLAAPEGTPVMAANNGIVTFADDLIISGNVVTIDHGYGLFSSHLHLYKIYVEEGQEVTKGEVIGEVGSTGYSTGPHLHWSLSKNGVFVNPWTFVNQDPLADF